MTTVERLSRLWTEPVAEGPAAIAAFGELYTDPVSVNGADTPLVDLVERSLPMGGIAPTGRRFKIRTIDVLSITGGRISAIQVVPENLGLVVQLGAIG